jgi:hypothetical protein
MSNFAVLPDIQGVTIRIGAQALHVPVELCHELGRALIGVMSRAESARHLETHGNISAFGAESPPRPGQTGPGAR